ncbi:17980_t:CDS:2, partial [Gigaspora rosea]
MTKLKKKVASMVATDSTLSEVEELQIQLNEAAEQAFENWCRKSKARWIKKGESNHQQKFIAGRLITDAVLDILTTLKFSTG